MENKSSPLEKLIVSTFGFCVAAVLICIYSEGVALAWNCAIAHPFHLPDVRFYQVAAAFFLVGAVKRIFR